MRILVGVLLLGGCGDDLLGGVDGVVSGSRLRARYFESGDTRIFRGFHDAQLEVDCEFRYDDDTMASAHCLPEIQEAFWFRDAACTDPVFPDFDDPCAPPPAYVGVADAEACVYTFPSIWERGPVVALDVVYVRSGDPCEARVPEYTFHAAGAEVPRDTFVRARVEVDGGSTRLRRVSYRAVDGARATARIYDDDLEVSCDYLFAQPSDEDATYHCMPPHAYGSDQFADSACSRPLATTSASCPVAGYIATYECDGNACTASVFERGDAVTPDAVYETPGGVCAPAASREDSLYFDFGSEVAIDRLAAAERLVEDPMARVSQYELRASDGFRMRDSGLFDTTLGVDCTPVPVDDGWRCVPQTEYADGGDVYRDDACTEPVTVAYRANPGRGLDNTVFVQRAAPADACASVSALYTVEPAPIATLYRVDPDGVCSRWEIDPTTYHEVAEALPLDAYAWFRDVVD